MRGRPAAGRGSPASAPLLALPPLMKEGGGGAHSAGGRELGLGRVLLAPDAVRLRGGGARPGPLGGWYGLNTVGPVGAPLSGGR